MQHIWKFYLFAFTKQLIPINSVLLPLMVANDLTTSQFFTSIVAFRFVQFICEVPTAYFADRFGRKLSLIISVLFLFIANLFLFNSVSFFSIIFYQIFMSLSNTFMSGSDNSLIFDLVGEENYKHFYTEKMFYKKLGTIISGVLSTISLYFINYKELISVQFVLVAFSIISVILLPKSESHKVQNDEKHLNLKDVLKMILTNHKYLSHISFLVIMATNFFILLDFMQPLLLHFGFDKSSFALGMTLINVLLVLFLKRSKLFIKYINNINEFGMFIYFPIVLILILIPSIYTLCLFFFAIIGRSFYFLSFADFTTSADSKYRTVFDSFFNFTALLFLSIFTQLSALLIKNFGLFRSLGIIYSILFLLSIIVYKYYKKNH